MNEEDRLNAGRAIVGKVIAEEVARGIQAIRAEVEPNLVPGEKIKAFLPGGIEVGTVTRSETSISANVTDNDALLAWVKKNRPEEILTVEYVRASYLTYLKDRTKELGQPVDGVTGEIIPGIELTEGTSSYIPRPSADGRALILHRLHMLNLSNDLLEIPHRVTTHPEDSDHE